MAIDPAPPIELTKTYTSEASLLDKFMAHYWRCFHSECRSAYLSYASLSKSEQNYRISVIDLEVENKSDAQHKIGMSATLALVLMKQPIQDHLIYSDTKIFTAPDMAYFLDELRVKAEDKEDFLKEHENTAALWSYSSYKGNRIFIPFQT